MNERTMATRRAALAGTAVVVGTVLAGGNDVRRAWADVVAPDVIAHEVGPLENLWEIQQTYGVAWEEIAATNGIDPSAANDLDPGSTIYVPQTKVRSLMVGQPEDGCFDVAPNGCEVSYVEVPSTHRTGVSIMTRVVRPTGEGPFPAVVINPGHSGDKDMHWRVGNALGNAGIASIAMDFSGNGQSVEGWPVQCITTMVDDSNDCLAWLMCQDFVDPTRIGLFGQSMGARIGCTILGRGASPYVSAVMVAPYAGYGEYWVHDFLSSGGYETMESAYDYALACGSWGHLPSYGWYYGPQWFEDMRSDPCRTMSRYTGSLLVIFGGADTIVPQAVARRLMNSAPNAAVKGIFVDIAAHEHGLTDGSPANVAREVIEAIVGHFAETL